MQLAANNSVLFCKEPLQIFLEGRIDYASVRDDGCHQLMVGDIKGGIETFHLRQSHGLLVPVYALPMKADRTAARAVYERMKADARRWQAEGKRVAIGVEGDISIYASVHYLLDELAAEGIATEQMEGIPSFIAGAAAARLSLISGQERLLVVPGNLRAAEVEPLLESRHVLVVMKLSQCEAEVKAFMRAHPGREYHYFENISLPEACHLTDCEAILGRRFPYFSQLLIK